MTPIASGANSLATVCERALQAERNLRRSRAYGSGGHLVSDFCEAGQRHADYLKLTVITLGYGLRSHRMRESRIRCDYLAGGNCGGFVGACAGGGAAPLG